MEEILETRKRVLQEDHPDIAVSMNNLANAYHRQGGKMGQVNALLLGSVRIWEKAYPEGHPNLDSARQSLKNLRGGILEAAAVARAGHGVGARGGAGVGGPGKTRDGVTSNGGAKASDCCRTCLLPYGPFPSAPLLPVCKCAPSGKSSQPKMGSVFAKQMAAADQRTKVAAEMTRESYASGGGQGTGAAGKAGKMGKVGKKGKKAGKEKAHCGGSNREGMPWAVPKKGTAKAKPNSKCSCGSGAKYKKCCGKP